MSEDELRARLRGETDPLSPDVAGIVRLGTARGRSRRRRAVVGTSAATVLALGAVAAGAVFLGPGVRVHTGGIDAADGATVSSTPAVHDSKHRTLQGPSTISQHLSDLLPGSGDAGGAGSVSVGGSAGSPGDESAGQLVSTSTSWHHGFVTLEVSDAAAGPTTTAVTVDPSNGAITGPAGAQPVSSYDDPQQACRADAAQAGTVTVPCHEVENGDWSFSSTGLDSDEYLIATPADAPSAVAVSPGSEGGTAGYSSHVIIEDEQGSPVPLPGAGTPQPVTSVTLFTTDAWRLIAWATAPDGSAEPVLGDADLQALTQDGGWFVAPGQTPSAEPSTGPACDPCEASTLAAPVTPSDRSPVAATELATVFAHLVPGQVGHVVVDDASADHPAASFTWNGYAVKVAVARGAIGTCGQPTPNGACSNGHGTSFGTSDATGAGASTTMSGAEFTADGWQVSIQVSGSDPSTDLTEGTLGKAAASDDWFHPAD